MLEIRDLVVSYGRAEALHGVSLDVSERGTLAVLGANGAGKSTLLRAVSGMLPYQLGRIVSGSIRFEGHKISGLKPGGIVRRGIVQVPEGRRVFAKSSVKDNLRAGGIANSSRKARAVALDSVLDMFPRLAERLDQKAGLLSGGEQQMLALGRALMAGPRMLLLDEPSLGLAPIIVQQIGDIVRRISDQGVSVVLVEQNAKMALAASQRGVVMELGRLSEAGSSEELQRTGVLEDLYLGRRHREPSETLADEVTSG